MSVRKSVKKYIDETERIVNLHIKDHQRDVRLKHVTQSALSQHNIQTGHQIFDKTTTVTTASYFPKKNREALEIQKYSNNLNRDNGYNIRHMENCYRKRVRFS